MDRLSGVYDIFRVTLLKGIPLFYQFKSFIKKHEVNHFTIVADAAMISVANIQELKQANIHYIPGARLGNVSGLRLAHIDKCLAREDGSIIRMGTDNRSLICSYSAQRLKKGQCANGKTIRNSPGTAESTIKNQERKIYYYTGRKSSIEQ